MLKFQVFSKDREGCIPPEELKFVLANLPNNVGFLQTYQTMKPFKESTIINILLGLETNVRWKTFLWRILSKFYFKVCPGEIEDMIAIVDKNGDGDSLSFTLVFTRLFHKIF